jgi:transposase InsO family protein
MFRKACLYGEKLYQFTAVDEYSRWCFREIYAEHSDQSARDFLKKLLKAAPLKILEVQTDNGHEWRNALFGAKVYSPTRFEEELVRQHIQYRRIRVGTPKHNGRVERQHGLDMSRFYRRLNFVSLEDARQKVSVYNDWSNTRIKICLNFRSPLQVIADYA